MLGQQQDVRRHSALDLNNMKKVEIRLFLPLVSNWKTSKSGKSSTQAILQTFEKNSVYLTLCYITLKYRWTSRSHQCFFISYILYQFVTTSTLSRWIMTVLVCLGLIREFSRLILCVVHQLLLPPWLVVPPKISCALITGQMLKLFIHT